MTETNEQKTGSAFPRENPKHWIGVEAEDIPQGWMDDMVKRLFEVLNRDMIRLESEQIGESDKKDERGEKPALNFEKAAKKSRLLTQMRNNLEKLRAMEMKRVEQKPKVTVSDDEERAELQREIDRIIAAENAGTDSSGTSG